MKKFFAKISIYVFLFFGMTVYTYALDLESYMDILKESIPNDVKDNFSNLEMGYGLPDFSDIFSFALNEIGVQSLHPIKILCTIIFIEILSSIYHSLSNFLKNKGINNIFETVCSLVIALSILKLSFESLDVTYSFIKKLSDFSLALFPLTSSVCILSGNLTEATVSTSAIILFVGVCDKIMCLVLIPILKIILALSVCSSVNTARFDVGGVIKLLKNVFSTIIGFVMMLFLSVLSYQSIIAGAADNLGVRTVKFTAGSAIPIVGTSVGEALRTVGGSLSLLKSTIGGVGVSVILLLLLPCILSLLLERISLSVGAAISRIFGCKRESELLESILSVYGYTTSLVCVCSIMLIFILSIFSSVSASLGGV